MNRKLFFGLFIFPLVIAIGMAVLLCSVVFLTHEEESPESLVAAIKTTSPAKRWQKAFELSNELNRSRNGLRNAALLQELTQMLEDPTHYDVKTRTYIALALGHFQTTESIRALVRRMEDPAENEDVALVAMWSLATVNAIEAVLPLQQQLRSGSSEKRKTAAYALGAMAEASAAPSLKNLLNDPVADVRWNAALALARLKDSSGLDVLHQMLHRSSLKSEYALADDTVEAVMINATKGLALIQRPDSIKILESVSRNDESLKVRQAAIEALQHIGKNR